MSARTSYTSVTAAQISDATTLAKSFLTSLSGAGNVGPIVMDGNGGTASIPSGAVTTMGVLSPPSTLGVIDGVVTTAT